MAESNHAGRPCGVRKALPAKDRAVPRESESVVVFLCGGETERQCQRNGVMVAGSTAVRRDTGMMPPLLSPRRLYRAAQGVGSWPRVAMVTTLLWVLTLSGTLGANVPLPDGESQDNTWSY